MKPTPMKWHVNRDALLGTLTDKKGMKTERKADPATITPPVSQAVAEIIAGLDLGGEIHWEGEGDARNAYLYVEIEGTGPTELIWTEAGWDYHSLCAHGRPDNDALMERVRDWANAEFAEPVRATEAEGK